MRPAWVKAIVATCSCAAAVATAQTLSSADFATRWPLTTAGDGLHVIELPEPVYRAAQTRDLADLRIFNAQDQALPIAFVPAPAPVAPTPTAVDLRLARLPAESEARESLLRSFALRVERDRERAVVEIGPLSPAANAASEPPAIGGYLIDARPLKDLKGRLVLTFSSSAADYAGRVNILGSDDLVFWRPLASGALARSRSLGDVIERNRFELDRPPAFLRVAWTSKDAPDIERRALHRTRRGQRHAAARSVGGDAVGRPSPLVRRRARGAADHAPIRARAGVESDRARAGVPARWRAIAARAAVTVSGRAAPKSSGSRSARSKRFACCARVLRSKAQRCLFRFAPIVCASISRCRSMARRRRSKPNGVRYARCSLRAHRGHINSRSVIPTRSSGLRSTRVRCSPPTIPPGRACRLQRSR